MAPLTLTFLMNHLKKAIASGQQASFHKWNTFVQPPLSLNAWRRVSGKTLSRQMTNTYCHTFVTSTLSSPRNPSMSCQHLSHGITLSNSSQMQCQRLSASEQKELDEFLKENLESGRIRPSKSPMAAPVFFVKKKDGKLRLVQDYHALNAMTMKNKYPLPLIPELIAKLRGAKYFMKLDVRWGFNNVCIKEGCKGNPLMLRTPSHTEHIHLLNTHAHQTPALTECLHSSNAHTHRTPTLTEHPCSPNTHAHQTPTLTGHSPD